MQKRWLRQAMIGQADPVAEFPAREGGNRTTGDRRAADTRRERDSGRVLRRRREHCSGHPTAEYTSGPQL